MIGGTGPDHALHPSAPAERRVSRRPRPPGSGEFDVLATLRRSGSPYPLVLSALSAMLMLSRAGMTNRLDRLEAAGLIERRPDRADRRSFLIALTTEGRRVVATPASEGRSG